VLTHPDRLDNPHRIGLTPSERAAHVPGRGVKTEGIGKRTTAHLNLTLSEADLYDIKIVHVGSKAVPTYKWFRKYPRPT
jgi:hypothetical protein